MNNRTVLLGAGLAVLVLAVTLALYPQLPDQMPTHFNAAGDPDAWGAKTWAAFIGLGMMVFVLALYWLLPWLSPKQFEVEAFRSTYDFIMLLLVVFAGYMQGLLLWAALADGLNIGRAIMAGVFLLIALMGNVTGKLRRNFWMGIRLPWTLADERVWYQTHRFAAKVYTGLGILGFAAILLGLQAVPALALLIAGIMLPVVYSLLIFKTDGKGLNWRLGLLGAAGVLLFTWGFMWLMSQAIPMEMDVPPLLAQRSEALLQNMVSGDYEQAREHFDPAMQRGLSAQGMQSAWGGAVASRGEYLGHGDMWGRKAGRHRFVYIPLQFREGEMNLKVVYSTSGQVSGLWLEAAGGG